MKNNFLNSRNYYKNLKAEKKYFIIVFSKKFSDFFEKLNLILIGLLLNYFLFIFYINNYKIFDEEIKSILLVSFIYIFIFLLLNLHLILAFYMKVKRLLDTEIILLKRFINYKDKIVQFSLKLYFLIFILLLLIIYLNLSGNIELKDLILNFLYGSIFIQIFLLRIGSGEHIKNNSHTIILLKTIILIIFFGLISFIQKIQKIISNIFLIIFYPLLKISFKNKKFYNIDINGNIFIKKRTNIILVTMEKQENKYKNPLGNLDL